MFSKKKKEKEVILNPVVPVTETKNTESDENTRRISEMLKEVNDLL